MTSTNDQQETRLHNAFIRYMEKAGSDKAIAVVQKALQTHNRKR